MARVSPGSVLVAEPVDDELVVVDAGVAGEDAAGVVAAVGDVELVGPEVPPPAVGGAQGGVEGAVGG